MVKIPEYQVDGFSPTAVGVPSESHVGERIGGAIETLGAALAQREEKLNQTLAIAKMGDFQRTYAQVKADMQKQYRDKPKEYASAVQESATKIARDYAKGLQPEVAQKFERLTTAAIAGDSEALVGWGVQREQEQWQGAIIERYQNTALLAEESASPEEVAFLLSGTGVASAGTDSLPGIANDAREIFDETTVLKLTDQYRKDIVANHMTNRIYDNPALVESMIAQGRYDSILSASEKGKYFQAAKTARVNNAIVQQLRGIMTQTAGLADLQDAVNQGQAKPGDVNRLLEYATMNQHRTDENGNPMVSAEYISGLQEIQKAILNQVPVIPEIEQGLSAEFDRKWEEFLTDKGPKARPKTSDYDNLLGLYAGLLKAKNEGKINNDVFERKRKILEHASISKAFPRGKAATLSEAIEKAGEYPWFQNPRDTFSRGYTMIRTWFKNQRPDLSVEERRERTEKAMLDFTEQLQTFSDDQIKALYNNEAGLGEILFGSQVKKTPGIVSRYDAYSFTNEAGETFPIFIGQTIMKNGQGLRFMGVNKQTGNYMFAPVANLWKAFNE